jgi:glucose/arabinose dehydrogenase
VRLRGALPAAALAGLALVASPAAAQPVGSGEGGVVLRRLGTFDQPDYVAAAPGFRQLLFVVERPGRIEVLRKGKLLARPFLDISDRVSLDQEDKGLFSVAFPPDYLRSKRFYVYYTDLQGDPQIDEYRRSTEALASPDSRRAVLNIPYPTFLGHDGGQLQFHGRELLIGTGDGGTSRKPSNNAQNRDLLLGKLLRIVPRLSGGGKPYSIPRANPFVGGPGRDEIFSYGFRNPWRFSIEDVRKGPDRLLLADVGQTRQEEVDYTTLPAARGANFGWDAWEGFLPYNCGADCEHGGTPDPGGTTKPIFAYDHSHGCSITGGYRVRDPSLATLYRRYVYADYCAGVLRSFIPRLGGAVDDRPLGPTVPAVSSFGQTANGRLFVTSLEGPVFRIAPRPRR